MFLLQEPRQLTKSAHCANCLPVNMVATREPRMCWVPSGHLPHGQDASQQWACLSTARAELINLLTTARDLLTLPRSGNARAFLAVL